MKRGALAALLVCAACSGGDDDDTQNTEAIAAALAERLTDRMQFDDGLLRDTPIPDAHDGDAAFPQIDRIDAPDTLALGADFTVTLHTAFVEAAQVTGGIVHVVHSVRWFRIDQSFDPATGELTLNGHVDNDPDLAGEAFEIRVALRHENGGAGNYLIWPVTVVTP